MTGALASRPDRGGNSGGAVSSPEVLVSSSSIVTDPKTSPNRRAASGERVVYAVASGCSLPVIARCRRRGDEGCAGSRRSRSYARRGPCSHAWTRAPAGVGTPLATPRSPGRRTRYANGSRPEQSALPRLDPPQRSPRASRRSPILPFARVQTQLKVRRRAQIKPATSGRPEHERRPGTTESSGRAGDGKGGGKGSRRSPVARTLEGGQPQQPHRLHMGGKKGSGRSDRRRKHARNVKLATAPAALRAAQHPNEERSRSGRLDFRQDRSVRQVERVWRDDGRWSMMARPTNNGALQDLFVVN